MDNETRVAIGWLASGLRRQGHQAMISLGEHSPVENVWAELAKLRAEIKRLRAEQSRDAREWNETVPAFRADNERLRALLGKLHWKSIDKDNMEFRCDTTCYVIDEIRTALNRRSEDGKSS